MKISEIIESLRAIQAQFGDVEVYAIQEGYIDFVEYEQAVLEADIDRVVMH